MSWDWVCSVIDYDFVWELIVRYKIVWGSRVDGFECFWLRV